MLVGHEVVPNVTSGSFSEAVASLLPSAPPVFPPPQAQTEIVIANTNNKLKTFLFMIIPPYL